MNNKKLLGKTCRANNTPRRLRRALMISLRKAGAKRCRAEKKAGRERRRHERRAEEPNP